MTLKRTLAVAMLILPLSLPTLGQNDVSGGLTVRTTPQGARVVLSGDVIVSGLTPARFRQFLVGDYKLELSKHGYEKYSTLVSLDPTRPMELAIRLSPKTRFKATARSLFIPGWGQRYTDQKLKGTVFTLLAVGAVANYFLTDQGFNDKHLIFSRKLAEYDRAVAGGSIEDLRRLQPGLDKAQEDAYDAETSRRIAIGSVIAVWGLNVLDALFLSPTERAGFTVKGLTLVPSSEGETVSLAIRKEF